MAFTCFHSRGFGLTVTVTAAFGARTVFGSTGSTDLTESNDVALWLFFVFVLLSQHLDGIAA